MIVAVIGTSTPTPREIDLAEKAGALVARQGWTLVTGGLGGVMEAASRGAKSAGGRVVGILPGPDARDANAYVEIAVPTGLGDARNAVIANTADAFIAVGRGFGTLSEIAFARQRQKPVVAVGSWAVEGVVDSTSAEDAVERLAVELGRARSL